MYLNSAVQRALVIGGIALLAVFALIGWTRKVQPAAPAPANSAAIANPEPVANNPAPAGNCDQPGNNCAPAAPGYSDAYGQPVGASYSGSSAYGYTGSSAYGYAARSAVEPGGPVVYATSPFGPTAGPARQVVQAPAPPPVTEGVRTDRPATRSYYYSRPYYTYRHGRRVLVRRRPLRRSLEIIGGSAAGGALIGGLAGGGEGAGIGALAGGAGGLVYDRLTHKKKIER